jgi:hypothetical protein
MSIDASGTKYWTGHGGVVLVNDPIATVREVAQAYDVRWLALDRADAVPAVASILGGASLPPWLGPPILVKGHAVDAAAQGAAAPAVIDYGDWPVCPAAGDTFCSGRTATGLR